MNNDELRKLQKQEAQKRLEILQKEYLVHKNVLAEFKQNGTIYYSESFGGFMQGILYWLRNKKEFVNAVKEIEEKRNIFIYTCILTHTNIGDVLDCLYVSDDRDYWKDERKQLEDDGFVSSYCINLSDDFCSEFGGVQITGVNGGLARVC